MIDPSRKYRWILLGASILTICFLIAAAIRENFYAEWYRLQKQYRTILNAKATDDQGRAIARDFRVELKQISVPALKTVDRCVACHNGIDDPRMTDVSMPHAVHPGDILQHHPVDRFGCTICHQGQGPATTFHDAMGWIPPGTIRFLTVISRNRPVSLVTTSRNSQNARSRSSLRDARSTRRKAVADAIAWAAVGEPWARRSTMRARRPSIN